MTAIDLSKVTGTMLVTLQYRADDARASTSLLHDHDAVDAVQQLGRPFGRLQTLAMSGDRYLVVLRARQLDEWAAAFLRRHPGATVVQLGCAP
jgi:O-methyltransferase involved in polyketide biosynthesis